MTDSNRRDFLRALGRRAARDAREVAEVAAPVLRMTSPAGTVNVLRSLTDPAHEPGAPVVALDRSAAELPELVRDEGLSSRLPSLRALVRTSVGMRPLAEDPASAAAWLDRVAGETLLDEAAPMTLLVQVSLAADALAGTWLHGDGWLVVFVDGAGTASVVRLDAPASLTETAEAMALDAKSVLPHVGSAPVQALDLAEDERAAYARVRDGLGEEAEHHLLGCADELADDLGEGDWQLLVRVRICPTKDVFVWVADEDLDRAVAVIR